MKITFAFYECNHLGIEYLSSYLKQKNYDVSLVFDPGIFRSFTINIEFMHRFFDFTGITAEKILAENPDVVGFAVVSDAYGWAVSVAEKIKAKKDIPIVFGGIHPTSTPETVIAEKCIDYVCIGEGEEAMDELMQAIKNNKPTDNIPNIMTKTNGKINKPTLRELNRNLDSMPFPDKAIFYDAYSGFKDSYNIISSRGCPFKCTFCYNSFLPSLYGNKFLRQRSVDNVIEELKIAKEKYGIKRVFFVDDMFSFNLKWLKEFCLKYKEAIGLPFTCEIHPTVNQEIVDLLVNCGCVAVNIGIQTISEKLRKDVLNRPETNEEIIRTLKLFMNTNIFVYVDIILGIPGQDEEELISIIRFLKKYKPDYVLVNWLRCYPGTKIMDIMQEKGIFTEEDVKRINSSKDYTPFTNTGSSLSEDLGKLGNLIFISSLLPDWMINLLIDKKLYRKLGSSTYLPLRIYAIFSSFYTMIFSPKKRLLYFTPTWQIKYYSYWCFQKIYCKLKLLLFKKI